MFAIPLPIFVAAMLSYMGLRAALEGETPKMVLGLIAVCAGQSLITSLNQYYGLTFLGPVQPVTAMMIPLMAYLTFISTALRPLRLFPDALHLSAPLLMIVIIFILRDAVDGLLVCSFVIYGVLLLIRLRKGADTLPLIRLEHDNRAIVLWRWVAFALIASAAGDAIIFGVMSVGAGWLRPWIISVFSSTFLLVIGALNMSDTLKASGSHDDALIDRPIEPIAEIKPAALQADAPDPVLLASLKALMRDHQAYLDPDLTLGRIARKLRIPEKQLSAAINQATGANVSRYINGFRIDHACQLLAHGTSVTSAMYASGFNTKSNFNREFQRVKGCSPSRWLKQDSRSQAPHPV
ncbi:helix-turn-helix domain-containing protein [Roseibium algae]|uniref:Helix-turn-helix domain-containing protein n=1 Tax=Roseibium algae TaxID=3123038 RepID=A0ABU8TIQ1_9HYPH